ncbi:MAG: glycosyltransferase [Bacteroidota bacterium]
MNILHVIGSMNPSTGGPCQGLRNSIPELEKMGVHREVVSLDDPGSSFIGRDTFPIHALGPGKGPWCYSAKLLPWLIENMDRFDAVIVNGLWLFHSYAVQKAMTSLRNRRKANQKIPKLFIMPHGMLDPYFQKASGRKLKAIRNWIYWKLIESKIVNKADGLLFTCEEELRLARQPFKPYRPKMEINVSYGIAEPPVFTPNMKKTFIDKCPALNGDNYLLFLSRIHHKKGTDLLLKAYKSIIEDPKNASVKMPKLVIAGPGLETAYGEKLHKMVKDTPSLKQSVFFPGMLTGDAKWGAFYGCDAFVLPSHQENFGIAVAESLACSKPVLISDQVNIWREIKDAGAGIVAKDSQEGTLELITKWMTLTMEQQQAMGVQAFEAYERSFSVAPASRLFLIGISSAS